MLSRQADVVVVGAGLAGLACALELTTAGREVLVLEKGSAPGGRVATDHVDGFTLDRGFQVLLDSYPQLQRLAVLDELHLHRFEPGALVARGGRLHRVVDPWRRPLAGLRHALAPIGSLSDKLALARWRARSVGRDGEPPEGGPDVSARQRLAELGFGPRIIESFFRPFFGGVFLDSELGTSARLLEGLFPLFARGSAALPRDGMGALPRALAGRLPDGVLRLGAGVASIEGDRVTLASGERLAARAVVVATDESRARELLGREPRAVAWNAATCLYFEAARDPVGSPLLVLDGEARGPVVNLCVPSTVAPSYAPPGRHLISAAVVGNPKGTGDDLVDAARAQVRTWFGPEVDDWRLLRTLRVPHALPTRRPGDLTPWQRPVRQGGRLLACGDWLDQPSIDGALASGVRAARCLLEDLKT